MKIVGEKDKRERDKKIFPLQYGLRLANGDSWSLYFSKDLIPWGREFTRILGLKEEKHHTNRNKIFFCSEKESRSDKYVKSIFLNQNGDYRDIPYFSFPGMEFRQNPSTNSYLFI